MYRRLQHTNDTIYLEENTTYRQIRNYLLREASNMKDFCKHMLRLDDCTLGFMGGNAFVLNNTVGKDTSSGLPDNYDYIEDFASHNNRWRDNDDNAGNPIPVTQNYINSAHPLYTLHIKEGESAYFQTQSRSQSDNAYLYVDNPDILNGPFSGTSFEVLVGFDFSNIQEENKTSDCFRVGFNYYLTRYKDGISWLSGGSARSHINLSLGDYKYGIFQRYSATMLRFQASIDTTFGDFWRYARHTIFSSWLHDLHVYSHINYDTDVQRMEITDLRLNNGGLVHT